MKLYNDQLIIVTGGAGFIGSCLIQHLNSLGENNIIIVDDLGTTEKWKNLVGKSFLDIISKHKFFDWLNGRESLIDAIIHLGACSSTVEKDASYLLENNYHFSVRLAEFALKHKKRFIYASSAATYGDGAEGYSDAHEGIEKLRPLNMYGYSKQLFDLWVKNEGVLNQVTGLKFFNVFGPNEAHKGRMASAVYHMLPQVMKEGVVRLFKSSEPALFGDGEQKRDFIYVKDVVRIISLFLENEATGIYNVGSGKASSWNDLAKALFKAVNKPPQIEYIDMPTDLIGKYQNFTEADMKKSKKVLKDGVVCMSLDNSVKDYVQNYLLKGASW